MRKLAAVLSLTIAALFLTPVAAHADPPGWKVYVEPTNAQCQASRKAFQAAGYQVTSCHPTMVDQWYFQYM